MKPFMLFAWLQLAGCAETRKHCSLSPSLTIANPPFSDWHNTISTVNLNVYCSW